MLRAFLLQSVDHVVARVVRTWPFDPPCGFHSTTHNRMWTGELENVTIASLVASWAPLHYALCHYLFVTFMLFNFRFRIEMAICVQHTQSISINKIIVLVLRRNKNTEKVLNQTGFSVRFHNTFEYVYIFHRILLRRLPLHHHHFGFLCSMCFWQIM